MEFNSNLGVCMAKKPSPSLFDSISQPTEEQISDLAKTYEVDNIIDKYAAKVDVRLKDMYMTRSTQLLTKHTRLNGTVDVAKLERDLKAYVDKLGSPNG